MLFTRWKFGRFAIPLLAVGVVLYMSYRPKFRLRFDMPPSFVDTALPSASQKDVSEKIAKAYWDCAVTQIQWKYSRAYLPPNPPPEFKVSADVTPTAGDPTERDRYWQKLQEVWYLPSSWTETHEWDLSWMGDPLNNLRARLQYYIEKARDL
jgi:hypothetical protein